MKVTRRFVDRFVRLFLELFLDRTKLASRREFFPIRIKHHNPRRKVLRYLIIPELIRTDRHPRFGRQQRRKLGLDRPLRLIKNRYKFRSQCRRIKLPSELLRERADQRFKPLSNIPRDRPIQHIPRKVRQVFHTNPDRNPIRFFPRLESITQPSMTRTHCD